MSNERISTQEQVEKKKALLRSMLQGIPTKESEVIKSVAAKTSTDTGMPMNEAKINTTLKSATEISATEQMGIPTSLPEDAIKNLMSGNKGKAKQILEEERDIPDSAFQTNKLLQERAAKAPKKLINENLPKSSLIANDDVQEEFQHVGISEEKVKKMIKESVYEILAEVFEIEEKKRLTTEQIQVRIGNTIFSGSLTPISKVKKK